MEVKSTANHVTKNTSMLIYGLSGVGKTTLAGTLTGKTLIISAEAGLLSLSNKEIDFIELEGDKLAHLREVVGWLVKGTEYHNIFVDSLTEIAELVVVEAERLYPDSKNSLQKWGHYNKVLKQLIKFLRDFANYNVIITALQKTDKDEIGRRFNIPDVSGSLATKLPQFFDFVFNLRVYSKEDKEVRALMTSTNDSYICKDRSGKLDTYEKPDLQYILNRIKENKNV